MSPAYYSEKLFSYGTLRYEIVQLATFGRKLDGSKDSLLGYKLLPLSICDPHVIRLSGEDIHSIATETNDGADAIEGIVFNVSEEELKKADEYEVADYKRISVQLSSGIKAWMYTR